MAQKPPIGSSAAGVTEEAFRVRATIDLDTMYQRLLNETRRQMTDLAQQGLSDTEIGDRLEVALNNLSDSPIEDMGRSSTAEAFNLGRNLEAQAQPDAIREVVRSEVLDENTCSPCRMLDGKIVAFNSEDYFTYMPPNFCEGRDRCRGFYIFRVGVSA